MKLSELLKDLSYTVAENPDIDSEKVLNTEISDVIYDSRKVKENCLFVCLNGSSFDGHKFAQAAVDGGAAAVLVCVLLQAARESSIRRAVIHAKKRFIVNSP